MTAELRAGIDTASQLLTLANVVQNEAGAPRYAHAARVAVAYAYLNRTGGTVREPKGIEVSHYRQIGSRWQNLSDADKLTFLRTFGDSVSAATERLQDADPRDSDPSQGATHWVSPAGLENWNAARKGGNAGYYSRTVETAVDKRYPTWAPPPGSPMAAAQLRARQITSAYREFPAAGVPEEHFLFYTGVKY